MAREPKDPVVFDLPDGDRLSLITWDFVLDKFESILRPICEDISATTANIDAINDIVDTWPKKTE